MRTTSAASIAGALLLAALAAGCSTIVQDSSGRDYINRSAEFSTEAIRGRAGEHRRDGRGGDDRGEAAFRAQLRAAAAVEPQLRFPARIGIARIENGKLSAIPAEESEAWLKTAQKLGPRFGEFVPVSPLIAELVASEQAPRTVSYESRLAETVKKLRLGAARQHVDAVLVYEVAGHANDRATVLSITDLSIVGLFVVPSRHLEAEGFATALLLDVRNGYPYGTATARAGDSNLVPSAGSTARTGDLLRAARIGAVIKLTGEVEKMAEAIHARQMRGAR
jgi:hypothetical protein